MRLEARGTSALWVATVSAWALAGGCGGSDRPLFDAGAGAGAKPGLAGEHFSFFVASYAAMQRLSGSQSGFGGDLRYGQPDGLSGADKICREIAQYSLPGAGAKTWRAFLSVTASASANGGPVHAIDRIGEGPWYDRRGRLVAQTKADLLHDRPAGADPAIVDDLPNEDGVPNHAPDGTEVDNHDILTGSTGEGRLYGTDSGRTCHDWTSSVGADGRPRVGHSWPRDFSKFFQDGGLPPFPMGGMGGNVDVDPSEFRDINGVSWMSSLNEAGCGAGANLIEMGPPNRSNPTVGSGGGYGGIYCFALQP